MAEWASRLLFGNRLAAHRRPAGGQPMVHTESTQSAKLSDITDLRVAIILIKLFQTKSIIDSFLSGTEEVGAVDRGRVYRLHCESGNVRR